MEAAQGITTLIMSCVGVSVAAHVGLFIYYHIKRTAEAL